ncbi:hypothetical protein ACUOCP_53560, partial [Escherichia sp. R-CC3]
GWIIVAAIEAIAYTVLAFAIVNQWSPSWVLISAIAAILVTVIVTRAGFLTGVRLAGKVITEKSAVKMIRDVSSFNIRIARQKIGI